jgi:hypothetical protein
VTSDPQPSPALEGAARRRRKLRDALFALEEGISSPVRTPEAWRQLVASRLDGLDQAFADHVTETERPGGLYDELEEMDVHITSRARRLREDHPALRRNVDEALALVHEPFPPETDLATVRDEIQRLMGRIVRHRQAGSDLVWEAYSIDIGTAG